jgi:hypothetical protein
MIHSHQLSEGLLLAGSRPFYETVHEGGIYPVASTEF